MVHCIPLLRFGERVDWNIVVCVQAQIQDAFAIAAYIVAFGTVSVGSLQALLMM